MENSSRKTYFRPSIFDMMALPTSALSRRDIILVAAARIFLQQSYEKTSMDLVEQEAGAARRTLYNQFSGGKEVLFQTMIERIWQNFPVLDIVSQAGSQSDIRLGLTHLATGVENFWVSPFSIDFHRMIIAEGRNFPRLTESFFQHGKIPAISMVKSYLEYQADQGRLVLNDSERAAR